MNHLVFVYGSLLSGLSNHSYLERHSAVFVSNAISIDKYFMIGLGSGAYPYLLKAQIRDDQIATAVKGEVYEVSETGLELLDQLEGHPIMYMREYINIQFLPTNEIRKAYVYFCQSEDSLENMRLNLNDPNSHYYTIVSTGDWRGHLESISESISQCK